MTRSAAETPLSNLAHLLVTSKRLNAENKMTALWGIAPSRPLLSSILGISEQSVLKLLKELSYQKVIAATNDSVEILDEAALERIALLAD